MNDLPSRSRPVEDTDAPRPGSIAIHYGATVPDIGIAAVGIEELQP